NHFFFDKPKVYFMHVGGEGALEALATAVNRVFNAVKDVRAASETVADSFAGRPVPRESTIDGAALERILGVKGTARDGMFKVVIGRETTASCGCKVGKSMGVNTWAAFAGTDANALVDGDFA